MQDSSSDTTTSAANTAATTTKTTTENTTTPVKKQQPQQQQQQRGRRSARVLNHDPIILPGFGTRKDVLNLSQQLSRGGNSFPPQAVEELMKSRGRGIRGTRNSDDATNEEEEKQPVSSAWADFMMEEGVGANVSSSAATEAGEKKSSSRSEAAASSSATASTPQQASNKKRSYELDFGGSTMNPPSKKKQKTSSTAVGGELLQTGTLDSTIVGRSKVKIDSQVRYHLQVPTRILSGIRITKVFTGCNATHSIAIDASGQAYGWGRNEASQLGSQLPREVVLPTLLDGLGSDNNSRVQAAALGKSHTLFLMQDDSLWGVGANKFGQCGVRTNTDVPNYRKCVVLTSDSEKIVQIACGENFSVALSSEGRVYTTGSSEFGQLGNGETGEYFVSANKLAFANANVFTKRTTFCHAPTEKLWANNDKAKVVPLLVSGTEEDVRIQAIACGKNHTLALEAASDAKPRVFSWGCGNYGVLGHGLQADEYFPRNIGAFHNIATTAAAAVTSDDNNKSDTTKSRVKIAAGAHCSLLQTANGHVYYWGKHRSVGEAVMRPQLVDALANNQHVVTHCSAGGQTVVASTSLAQTVAWGQGPHGELGIGSAKSSAKPNFVDALNGVHISDMACGYGHSLFVARLDDKDDAAAVKKLAQIKEEDVEDLIDAAEQKAAAK